MADAGEGEKSTLMSGSSTKRTKSKEPDWSRFGLSLDQQQQSAKHHPQSQVEHGAYQSTDYGNQNELFREDQDLSEVPWWKSNFFISAPVLFGTWDGVFTSCLINILSVVIFLRMGWIVGNAGIGLSIVTVFLSVSIVLIVALSAIGVCERCRMDAGGVYFLISHVLGGRIGGSVGIVYCFAQAVSCSLSVMGFGESVMELIGQTNPWIARGIAFGVVILLMGINVAGVKWVIRLQLVLLLVLFLSAMDLVVGSFVHTDVENGVTGYTEINFVNNSGPQYAEGESFFSIFGLFFATVTGILAGINMSGDLQDPFHNIPRGTLASLGVGTILYISFILVLGATCLRSYLLDDYMIAEKVSIVGFLWLAGLYLSSVSSCMGSLYGPPRILQSIANENVIPFMKILGRGRGPNKVPVYALIVITLVVLLFICVGQVNTLAPVVTTAFMLTYAAIDYSYFALAMSYDKRKVREARFQQNGNMGVRKSSTGSDITNGSVGYSTTPLTVDVSRNKDSLENMRNDLDKLFPERISQRGQHQHLIRQDSRTTLSAATTPEADFDATKKKIGLEEACDLNDTTQLIDGQKKQPNTEITKQPRSWYSALCNRWLSLFGTLVCLVLLFTIQWVYALGELTVFFAIYFYIGQASPGYFPGIAEFNFYDWIKECVQTCCRRGPTPPEQVVVAPTTPAVHTRQAQLTEDNEDFANRGRYHQSEVVQGKIFEQDTMW
ncbi:hypothetical protein SNE40_012745 [Patella caerulea]|uniref:Solute carrier family 12 member 8 n=1 Tax=Patella caerulea TaxID=87958 RepID=A0AAN8PK05_PATCE